jgi:protein gp37
MSRTTEIEWTWVSWNPITGCSKVSEGCRHCYAEKMALRLKGMGVAKYRNGFEVTIHPDTLETPLTWKKPQVVFVNSMADMFHSDIPFEFVQRVFNVMARADWHIFQILTKRSKELVRKAPDLDWPPNIWMGVTVENAHYTYRIDDLRKIPTAVRFLSMEPLLGPVPDMDLSGIDWVIVGGESGPGARPMKREWVLEIQSQCARQGTAFFFKQWGGVNKKAAGRLLQGRTWDEVPPALQDKPRLRGDQIPLGL